ncbi:MAG: hypothetical protein K2H85_02470, partial [Allobaculum sp.]|nr:hypothetical protein [Allobaculum sp.]
MVEKDYFEDSIFSRQYRNALKIIGGFIDNQNPPDDHREVPRIICFCGDRGEGKSSCMRTVAEILKTTGTKSKQMFAASQINTKAEKYLDLLQLHKLKETAFFTLEIMDPSYFDDNHNILELVVGEIYKTIRKKAVSDGVNLDRVAYNKLIKATEDVKESLFYIHSDKDKSFSEITQLNLLAASVELKESIKNMISQFLYFMDAERLLLEIDDLDMNMAGTYEMCEQIRNYLSFPQCIILMATKYDQMEYAVSLRMHKLATTRNRNEEDTYFRDLARKYLLKFIPVQIRIYMPKVYEGIVNQRMRCLTPNGKAIEEYKSIKDGVVKLIFRKTRYLFYNSKGGLSLIIPNNLRQLISLLNLLYGMDDVDDRNQPMDIFL